MSPSFWRERSVFLTGHTGFKGGWLAVWLSHWGARVHGYALQAPTQPSFFETVGVAQRLASHTVGDIRDAGALTQAMQAAKPDIVLHLAAQPLVRASYAQPVDTFATNVMGTVHVLEAVRQCPSVQAVVNVTTDKCYDNREWLWPYRENEALGGHDPYSSSKACSELVTSAYRRSFLAANSVAVATARAGNVVGGGDWAADRLVPDFFRAAESGRSLEVRFPHAVRPWQHVLEPLSGYLTLAQQLVASGQQHAEAWNFGPPDDSARPVQWVLDTLTGMMPGAGWHNTGGEHPHEAGLLKLDSSKAHAHLSWKPRWSLEEALRRTAEWQQAWLDGQDLLALSLAQIEAYLAAPAAV